MINMTTMKSRWAAVGAAVAVSLGAGGIGITHATISSGERAVFVPLDEPCRLASTRPAPNTVGPRTAGIGPEEAYTLDGWGTEGNCTLPSNTAGLALNVTAVNATQQTNLRFFPADVAVPATANLNPSPGAPPTPNAVNVNLDAAGQFKVFNKFGTVEVVIDVMGYYEDHNHDDRYEPLREVYRGQLAGRYPANTGFLLVEDSFQQPLPDGVPNLVLEYLGVGATSADCPGIGQSVVPGKLCVYAYNNSNIGLVNLSGGSTGENRRYGFALDVFPSNAAGNGFFLASWAYRVP